MLNELGKRTILPPLPVLPLISNDQIALLQSPAMARVSVGASEPIIKPRALCSYCRARRRIRDYEEEGEEEDESYKYNEEIAMLEMYSQSVRAEALIVNAVVDEQEVEVLIFKGFSSSLSHGTAADPSRSVVPRRAVIKSIDIIKGPFDPSNIQYVERGLTWEEFKTRLLP